jgi:hypothetical protein
MPTSNNKISTLIERQVPFHVRNDHPQFIKFLEAYYRFTEQEEGVVNTLKKLKDYNDIDKTNEFFAQRLYDYFIKEIPQEILADRATVLKHIKDFYTARGTQKSISFLLQALYNKTTKYYLPKQDILKVSDGKWFVERSLRVNDVKINGVANNNLNGVINFKNTRVTGNVSNASAIVENVDVYYDNGVLVNELKISGVSGNFTSAEQIFSLFDYEGQTYSITANLFSGIINSVEIINGGSGYILNDTVPIESNTGTGGVIIISSVSVGALRGIGISQTGAGFRANDNILISGGGGTGANGRVIGVDDSGTVHPNSYNIVSSVISLEANTEIGNLVYSNLNSANANTELIDALDTFVYDNCGPLSSLILINSGNNYSTIPTADVEANTRVRTLGILGKLRIVNGGIGYEVSDKIYFDNVLGSYGVGAMANVVNVSNEGSITEISFEEMEGHIIGGSGYSQSKLPLARVVSNNVSANGANIVVEAILGDGELLNVLSDQVGRIQELRIVSGGSNYLTAPTINLSSRGDGTAQATATVITGAFTYPGRYINDDGHLSSYNFIQDKNYYQNYSYVVKIEEPLENYRKSLNDLIHPSGLKLFGEYSKEDNFTQQTLNTVTAEDNTIISIFDSSELATYVSELNEIIITKEDHGLLENNSIYLEFISGDTINISNGLYSVISSNSTEFIVYNSNTSTSSGDVVLGFIV